VTEGAQTRLGMSRAASIWLGVGTARGSAGRLNQISKLAQTS
jgi:hypothetical protein